MTDWDDEAMQKIYRDWGQFLSKKGISDQANAYFTKSIELNQNDTGCLYDRSVNYLRSAKADKSLEDSYRALEIRPYDCPINLQYSDGYFYSNQFEGAITSLYNNSKKFKGGNLEHFKKKIEVLESTFNRNLSGELFPFAIENHKIFIKVGGMMRAEANFEEKLRWKQLLEEGLCDVDSIEVIQDQILHPREIERRKLAYKITNQNYNGKSGADVVFLNKLRYDKTLLSRHTPLSSKNLLYQVEDKFGQVSKFVKMLQARNPLYNLRTTNCPNKKLKNTVNQAHLYRVQLQTRRDMFHILAKIKNLRKTKNVLEMRDLIEDVMGKYTIIKTKKVMPWKFQFIYEVYNVLALTYIDECLDIPSNIMKFELSVRIYKLLHIEPLKEKENITYVFGDKSTYAPADAIDYEYISYKRRVQHLQQWLKFSDYDIEKAFIYNLMSQHHLEHGRFEECVQAAKAGRKAARAARSIVWKFLNILQIIRAQSIQGKFNRLGYYYKFAIKDIKRFRRSQNSRALKFFINMALNFNNDIVAYNKKLKEAAKLKQAENPNPDPKPKKMK